MSDTNLPHDKKLSIFDQAFTGDLSGEDRECLEQALRASPAVLSEYCNYVATHVELAAAVRLSRSRQVIYDEIRQRAQLHSSPAPLDAVAGAAERAGQRQDPPQVVAQPRPATGLNFRAWFAVLAASLFAALFVGWQGFIREGVEDSPAAVVMSIPPAPVATLTSQKGAHWQGGSLADGVAVLEGQPLDLRSGSARLSVGAGAELVMEAPCRLSFLTPSRLRLEDGTVAVHVAEWAKGFTVVTDTMEVVDLGTTFTVSTAPDSPDKAHVVSGLVRVHPRRQSGREPRGILLIEGEVLSVDRLGVSKMRNELPSDLIEELEMGLVQPYRPITVHNSGFGLGVGDQDPHWRVVSGPEGAFEDPEYAAVCSPHRRYMENDPGASQWVSIADWRRARPSATYTFQTTFDLAGYQLSTIQLFGRLLADNGIEAVRVNGSAVKVESWRDNELNQRFGDPQFRFVNVTEGLVQGLNVVEVDVHNGVHIAQGRAKPTAPNPMALRVEWYAFGRPSELAGDVGIDAMLNAAPRLAVRD